MPIHVALITLAGWVAWAVPFFLVRRDRTRLSDSGSGGGGNGSSSGSSGGGRTGSATPTRDLGSGAAGDRSQTTASAVSAAGAPGGVAAGDVPVIAAGIASSEAEPTIDRRARWGILLVFFAYLIIWQPRYRIDEPGIGRTAGALLAFAAAIWLSWSSARTLGRQWRIDAGLNARHELVRTGAYRLVRHPIYLSMFGTLLGTGLLLTPWRLLPASVLLFIAGTEIRVRVEDRLLAARFGAEFDEYRRRVPAHLPFFRFRGR